MSEQPNRSSTHENPGRPMGPLQEGDQALLDAVDSSPNNMSGESMTLQKINIRGVPGTAVRMETTQPDGATQETVAAVANEGIKAEIENSDGMSQQEINMVAASRIKSAHEHLGKTSLGG